MTAWSRLAATRRLWQYAVACPTEESPATCSIRWIVRLAAYPGRLQSAPLDSAMLIAERDLQMKHMLAVTLETEVPRLDDAGMNGPDRDFVGPRYLRRGRNRRRPVGPRVR